MKLLEDYKVLVMPTRVLVEPSMITAIVLVVQAQIVKYFNFTEGALEYWTDWWALTASILGAFILLARAIKEWRSLFKKK